MVLLENFTRSELENALNEELQNVLQNTTAELKSETANEFCEQAKKSYEQKKFVLSEQEQIAVATAENINVISYCSGMSVSKKVDNGTISYKLRINAKYCIDSTDKTTATSFLNCIYNNYNAENANDMQKIFAAYCDNKPIAVEKVRNSKTKQLSAENDQLRQQLAEMQAKLSAMQAKLSATQKGEPKKGAKKSK